MGERTPLALLDAAGLGPHGGRRGADQHRRGAGRAPRPTSSCRPTGWRRPAIPARTRALYDTVRAVAMELCPALGVAHPGRQGLDVDAHDVARPATATAQAVTAPLSLIVTAFAPVADVRRALTPQLRLDRGETALVLDRPRRRAAPARRLGAGAGLRAARQRLPRSRRSRAPRRVLRRRAGAARRRAPARLPRPRRRRPVRHARRDGVRVALRARRHARRRDRRCARRAVRRGAGRGRAGRGRRSRDACSRGSPPRVSRRTRSARRPATAASAFAPRGALLLDEARVDLHRAWSATTHALQRLRDDPDAATEEYDRILDAGDPGLAPRADLRSARRRRGAVRRDRPRGRRSPSCASRASTARSRWRPRSTAPASPRTTCT